MTHTVFKCRFDKHIFHVVKWYMSKGDSNGQQQQQ